MSGKIHSSDSSDNATMMYSQYNVQPYHEESVTVTATKDGSTNYRHWGAE